MADYGWACPRCTLINALGAQSCAACGFELAAGVDGSGGGGGASVVGGIGGGLAACGSPGTLRLSVAGAAGEGELKGTVERLGNKTSIEVLQRLFGNLLEHPEELKFRGPLQKSNERIRTAIVETAGASEVLRLAGFQEGAEAFFMAGPPSAERLGRLRVLLAEQAAAVEGPRILPPVKRRKPKVDEDLLRELEADKRYIEELRGCGRSQACSSTAGSPALGPAPPPPPSAGGGAQPPSAAAAAGSDSGVLRLRLRLPLGGRMELEVAAGCSAAELRAQLKERTGMPPRLQRLRIGYPPRIYEAFGDELLVNGGFHDCEVVYLENTRDLFLGNLETGAFTMGELLDRVPDDADAEEGASTGALFLQALEAFAVDMDERSFWAPVRQRLQQLPSCSEAERGQIQAGLRVLRLLFDSHDPRERLALVLDCRPRIHSDPDGFMGRSDSDGSGDDDSFMGSFFGGLRGTGRRGRQSHSGRHHGGTVNLQVDRGRFLGSVAQQVLSMSPAELAGGVRVTYVGEQGTDAGGLTRDFFSAFATQLGDAEPLLWELSGRGSLQPVPGAVSSAVPGGRHPCGLKPSQMYRACGRVFGLAVLAGCKLGRRLSRSFVRLLIGDILEDTQTLQEELRHEAADGVPDVRTTQEMLDRPLEQLGLAGALTFEWSVRGRVDLPPVELVQGGSKIAVTDQNKAEWLLMWLHQEVVESAMPAVRSFRQGLADVFGGAGDTCPLLCLLGAEDLLDLWGKGGVSQQDVSRWRAVAHVSTAVAQQADWLWQVLKDDYDDEMRGKVLQFSTGSSTIGREGLPRFVVEPADGDDGRLPTAMTCGNMLQLPRYSCKEVLSWRLKQAAEMCCTFQMS